MDRIVGRSSLALGVMSGSLLLGCAAGLDEEGGELDDESLAEVESSLSLGRTFASWGTTNGPDLDIGPASTQTCFLAGVAGNLNAGWGWDHGGRASEAGLTITNGRWILTSAGGLDYGDVVMGNTVNAHVVCVGTTANRTFYSDGGAGGSVNRKKVLEPVAANRQCFLRQVSGYSGTWASSSARVKLIQENGNWVLESANLGVSAGIPYLGAVCFDIPAGTWVGTGSWGAANPGSGTFNVLGEATAGACGLTGIQGPLKNNEWDDGAMITWPSSSPGTWTIRVEDGKTGFVTCLH
ncbi:MAG: hypothetical protein ACTHU0_09030 [Kofleriaceae bacterium]